MATYKWFKDDPTVQRLAQLTGANVAMVVIGDVDTGETEEMGDGHGNKLIVPVTKKGVQVDVVGALNPGQLAQLDKFLAGYTRV